MITAFWYLLVTESSWQNVPLELGCSVPTSHRRLRGWNKAAVCNDPHMHLCTLLRKAGIIEDKSAIVESVVVHAFGGGDAIVPGPAECKTRGTRGTRQTLVVNGNRGPLVIRTAPVDASDHGKILPAVADVPRVPDKRGLRRSHPDVIFADRGYDGQAIRDALHAQDIEPFIALRREEHGSSLGR